MNAQDAKHLASIKKLSVRIGRQAAKVETLRTEHLAEKHTLETDNGHLRELIDASPDQIAQLELDFEVDSAGQEAA